MGAEMYTFIMVGFGALLLLFTAGVGSLIYGKFWSK